MTKKTLPVAGIAASSLLLALLAGCKITDDKVDSGFSGVGSGQDGGSAPIIWGDPERSALVGGHYAFRPDAEDPDGDVLEFSIENKPEWASFDSNSGLLTGIPSLEDVGQHSSIVISVSDTDSVVSLPSFSVRVDSPLDADGGGSDGGTSDDGSSDDGSASSPPSISGTPNTAAVVGQAYEFRPEVSDPDGDDLSFSIINRPRWLNFNTTTGRLHGTPKEDNIGSSRRIEISVTDGTSIAALPRFKITVDAVGTMSKELSWTPPTQNEDGSPLTNLAGYRIYYGTASGNLGQVIELNSPGLTSYVIEGLAPGTYYLEMTSFNTLDMESHPTPEISFTL